MVAYTVKVVGIAEQWITVEANGTDAARLKALRVARTSPASDWGIRNIEACQPVLDRGKPIAPRSEYEMFTPEGNEAVANAVNVLIASGVNGAFHRKDLPAKIREMCDEINHSYGEVFDTKPQYHIQDEVNERLCDPMGWVEISRWDW